MKIVYGNAHKTIRQEERINHRGIRKKPTPAISQPTAEPDTDTQSEMSINPKGIPGEISLMIEETAPEENSEEINLPETDTIAVDNEEMQPETSPDTHQEESPTAEENPTSSSEESSTSTPSAPLLLNAIVSQLLQGKMRFCEGSLPKGEEALPPLIIFLH